MKAPSHFYRVRAAIVKESLYLIGRLLYEVTCALNLIEKTP